MTLVKDLDTPAVTVDLDIMAANIRRVQAHLDRQGLGNRPHIKTHKIPAIGRMQLDAGASGITCQKVGEVEVFADAGVAPDVLLAYNILGTAKLERLMAVARRVRPAHGSAGQRGRRPRALGGRRPPRPGRPLPHRVRHRRGPGRGAEPPRRPSTWPGRPCKLPRLDFRGLMTFPNKDPDTRTFFERALALFKRAGIPVPVVSGGGTPALATVDRFPMLTEHRAGTCVYNDVMQVRAGTGGLGRLRDADARHRGEPAHRRPRPSWTAAPRS